MKRVLVSASSASSAVACVLISIASLQVHADGEKIGNALAKDLPSLIVVPIDYSIDVAISDQLGAETVAT